MQTDTVHKQLEQFIRAGLSFEEAVSALRNLDIPVSVGRGDLGINKRRFREAPQQSACGQAVPVKEQRTQRGADTGQRQASPSSTAGLSSLKGAPNRAPRLQDSGRVSRIGRVAGKEQRAGSPRSSFLTARRLDVQASRLGAITSTCPRKARASAAWVSLRATLIGLGGVTLAAYVASLPWFLRVTDAGIAGLTWFLLYKLVRGYRALRAQ